MTVIDFNKTYGVKRRQSDNSVNSIKTFRFKLMVPSYLLNWLRKILNLVQCLIWASLSVSKPWTSSLFYWNFGLKFLLSIVKIPIRLVKKLKMVLKYSFVTIISFKDFFHQHEFGCWWRTYHHQRQTPRSRRHRIVIWCYSTLNTSFREITLEDYWKIFHNCSIHGIQLYVFSFATSLKWFLWKKRSLKITRDMWFTCSIHSGKIINI